MTTEINFDGLAGITHCFGGLSFGNEPSLNHRGEVSNPKLAALQGLAKMRLLHSLGVKQAILPPHERPYLKALKTLGYDHIKQAPPWILARISSSASMWAANSATVCPSVDSVDSHLHFTPANLATYYHRSIETETTSKILDQIFPNRVFFKRHAPLPSSEFFFDEGAANHSRFCKSYGGPGVQLFTFGTEQYDPEGSMPKPKKYPARQTKEASSAIARLHHLYPGHAVFALQHPFTVDAGAFHHDLVSVANQNVLLIHELALWKQREVIEQLKKTVSDVCDTELIVIEAMQENFPLKEALSSYLFNSQLITLPDSSMAIIAPESCKAFPTAIRFFESILNDPNNPINAIYYVDLSESLKNGGGPACLRLRVVMTPAELQEMNQSVLFSDLLYQQLFEHIHQTYPERLTLADVTHPKVHDQMHQSLKTISKILKLETIYV